MMARACALMCLVVASMPLTVARADAPRFEMTPWIGYRMGGEFVVPGTDGDEQDVDLDPAASYGIDLGVYRDGQSFYELFYSRQEASLDSNDAALANVDVSIEYFQVGGTALFESEQQWLVPYLSLTIGATRLAPKQGPYDSETKFSGTVGGGLRIPFNDRVAANFGLRGYLTFIDSDTDIFCVSGETGGTCLLRSKGSTIFQGEAQLGLTLRF